MRRTSHAWPSVAVGVVTYGSFLLLYAPIVLIVMSSFFSTQYLNSWQPFSLAWYQQAFAHPHLMQALQTSCVIALVSALIATTFGTALAVALYRLRFRARGVVIGVLMLPIVLPELVLGVALLLFFSRFVRPLSNALLGIQIGSVPAVIAGHVGFCLSYVVLMVGSRLAALDPKLEEAALDLGASPWQVVWRVSLPQCLPAIVGAALLTFTLSLDDFYVSYFASAGGSGFRTLPIQLYAMQTKAGVTPDMNAVASLLLLISAGVVGMVFWLNRRSWSR